MLNLEQLEYLRKEMIKYKNTKKVDDKNLELLFQGFERAINNRELKTYKLFVRKFNVIENEYINGGYVIKTNNIYEEIGKIYCNSIESIDRIDYIEIKDKEGEKENE